MLHWLSPFLFSPGPNPWGSSAHVQGGSSVFSPTAWIDSQDTLRNVFSVEILSLVKLSVKINHHKGLVYYTNSL